MDEKRNVPISKKDFIALEFLRLTAAINQTDPRSRDYAQLLENIERFGAAATMFDDLWEIFASYYSEQGIEFDDSPVAEEGKDPDVLRPFTVVQTDGKAEVEAQASPIPDEPEMFEEEEAPSEEAPVYDPADVKKAIGKARADGKIVKIKDWLVENFGVEGFTALPASKYGEAMEKLKALGVDT